MKEPDDSPEPLSSGSDKENGHQPSYTSLLTQQLQYPRPNPEKELKASLNDMPRDFWHVNHLLNEFVSSIGSWEKPGVKHSVLHLLNETLLNMDQEIKNRSIRVRREYDEPDAGFVMNKPAIMMAMCMIIENALQAMSPGKGLLTLITSSLATGYVIKIRDNGKGMSPEMMEKLFTPFFTTKPGALGLGLATVGEILFRNHVWVKIDSKENEGTTFTLFFEAK